MNSKNPFLSILAPAYNEEASIERVVMEWEDVISSEGLDAEIIVVNDGSTDRTGEVLDPLGQRFSNLKVITLDRNLGYGGALMEAVALAAGRYSMTIDSDGQFELRDYRPLLDAMEKDKLDVVTGRREVKKDKPLLVAADRALNLFVRLLFGIPFRDTNCALKMYRTGLLGQIKLKGMGWTTPTELLIRAHESGARIGEVAVRHYPRREGESKLNPLNVAVRFLLFLVYLRLELSFKRK